MIAECSISVSSYNGGSCFNRCLPCSMGSGGHLALNHSFESTAIEMSIRDKISVSQDDCLCTLYLCPVMGKTSRKV